jgi:hypothetical protein
MLVTSGIWLSALNPFGCSTSNDRQAAKVRALPLGMQGWIGARYTRIRSEAKNFGCLPCSFLKPLIQPKYNPRFPIVAAMAAAEAWITLILIHSTTHHSMPPERTPLSANRLFTWLAIIWITNLIVMPTLILDSQRTHSKDWTAVPLPHMESGHLGAHYFGDPDD